MRFAKTLMICASLGVAAAALAPSAEAGVVIGISLPVPVVAPVAAAVVTPVVQTVPASVVYVNPVFGLYGGPCCFYGGYRHFYGGYGGYGGRYGYRGGVHTGVIHGVGGRR